MTPDCMFDRTTLRDAGVTVLSVWPDGDAEATHLVQRCGGDAVLMTKTFAPAGDADFHARHWSLCECIRLGIAVFGDDPAASEAKEAHHGAA